MGFLFGLNFASHTYTHQKNNTGSKTHRLNYDFVFLLLLLHSKLMTLENARYTFFCFDFNYETSQLKFLNYYA